MPITEAAILERILEPRPPAVSPEVARYLLTLDFPPADRQRMADLDAKSPAALTAAEQLEREHYRHVAHVLDRLRDRARQILERPTTPSGQALGPPRLEIPPGIRRSQEALRRDLPRLLANRNVLHHWVAYHGDERIGLARDATTLLRECIRRGLAEDQYCISWIDPTELLDEEDLGPPPPGEIEEGESIPAA